ncbi:hypothetical protein PQ465_11420 [Sphingobacterium oryzagri]|uniref:Uncharacterized protein n=1 Tax=Sphingobacterium oryzagri TaxID=3025669 RepID=A0ABY7WDG4_9SPHI|nr:hypothetical protein [Sphingobacterium sp. KACC 22765]WDF66915.1 hypothetical protein PQ465_11420 [Sphingobacterium sp. KACC 22765]
MALKEPVLKIVNKIYSPLSTIDLKFGRYDLRFTTDKVGRPTLLLIGRKNENDKIVGERYSRRLKIGPNGEVIKDHWDNQGKA